MGGEGMFRRLVLVLLFLSSGAAQAHDWYKWRRDPVTNKACCGGEDCAQLVIRPGVLTPEADGYRIILTQPQAEAINPNRADPLDILVPFSRVQDSEDGNYHLCIPSRNDMTTGNFYCFFAPPNT